MNTGLFYIDRKNQYQMIIQPIQGIFSPRILLRCLFILLIQNHKAKQKLQAMNKIESSTEKWIEKSNCFFKQTGECGSQRDRKCPIHQAMLFCILPKFVYVNLRQMQEEVVTYDSPTYKVTYEDCQKLTYSGTDVSDMVDLEELNEPELLYNLKRRYLNDSIFTYCGPTLVIINPYVYVERLFNDVCMFDYQTYVFQDNLDYKNLPPHVFGLAAFCLWQLFQNSRNQSIVISGESGAGKTENTKYCLKFLASLGKNLRGMISDNKLPKLISARAIKGVMRAIANVRLQGIEDKILGCNQILQAFGNAKTIRNDNSSRFGKLILLLYGETQIDIRSAFIVSYLLQKSRIVSISEGERNYHIFYYVLKGTTPEEKKDYMLIDTLEHYKYLSQSSVTDIRGVSDQRKFQEVQNEFALYFSKEQTRCIFRIISVVLNVGNLVFKKQYTKNNEQMAVIINKQYLGMVAKLLEVDLPALEHSFQFKTRKMGASVINSPLRYDQAVALQNSFAKNIYERTFMFLVVKLNEKIELEKVSLEQGKGSFRKSIGLLDIFGFEVLGVNSLEQFFINFANQKLQQLYVSYIFKEEQNEFLKEGLKEFSHDIGFQDNKPVIDLFELYPLGLFHLINESSELNKPDEDLPEAISKNHPKNVFVQLPKSKRGIFLISHSCSPVNYNTAGFTSRNKDEFPQQLLDVIFKSTNQVLKTIIFGDGKAEVSKNRTAAKKFLGSKFLNEMNKLTEELYSSDCHFVRCIKPNSLKAPKNFNSEAVLQSLRYLGVLDSILIRKLGYIYRRPFKQFLRKFFQIEQYVFGYAKFIEGKTEQDFKQYSKSFILKHASNELNNREILQGNKKILIKQSALNHLESMAKEKRKMRIQCANKIKRMYVSSVFRGKVKQFLMAVKVLKGHMLALVQGIRLKLVKKKCIKIQRHIRKYLLDKRLQKIKAQAQKSVTMIVSVLRMKKQRRAFLKTREQVIKVQANIRFFLNMAKYFRIKNCQEVAMNIFEKGWVKVQNSKAVYIQKCWKGYTVRRRLRLVMEEIRRKLRLAKYREFLMEILFKQKYQKFIVLLNRYKKPVVMMQAIVRGKFARRSFLLMKASAIVIQSAFRRYLRKKYYLIRLWRDYRKNIHQEERLKAKQVGRLGVTTDKVNGVKYYPETVGVTVQLYPQELQYRYARGQPTKQSWQLNQTVVFNDKNTFQMYIGDYDILGTQYYQGKWLVQYSQVKEQMKRKNQYPIYLSLGEQTTSVLSNKDKLYTFSAGQKEALKKIDVNSAVQMISSGDRTTILLRQDGKLYVWGSNYQHFINDTDNGGVDYNEVQDLSKLQVQSLSCKGSKRYFVGQQGKSFSYLEPKQFNQQWKISLVNFGPKNIVKTVAASYYFTLFLTTQGHVYAEGTNRKGELGLGFTSGKQVNNPQLITYFYKLKDQIETISVGLGHSVAKSKLGHVYTWGDNCYKQVTHLKEQFIHTPLAIESNQEGKIKVCQAVAGARATFLLTDNLRTIGMGTSSSFPTQKGIFNVTLQLLKQTSSCKNLAQIKLSTRWIRQLSILVVNAIDTSRCKTGTKPDIIFKYAKMLAKEWIDDTVYPSYHEWTDNILQLSDLRRFKFGNGEAKGKNASGKAKNGSKGELEQLRALLQLRKTSGVFKKAAAVKTQEILQRLNSIAQAFWSESDHELNRYIQENSKFLK